MYSIILTNGMTINIKATSVEWYEKSNTIKLLDDGIVVARFNMDNIAGWVKADHKVEADGENKTESEKDGIAVIFAGCQEMLSNLDLSMRYALEFDPSIKNSWLFDKIIDWRKMIRPYIKEE